jgi:hypothetical protein
MNPLGILKKGIEPSNVHCCDVDISSSHPFIQINQGIFFLIIYFFCYKQSIGTNILSDDKENRLKAEGA